MNAHEKFVQECYNTQNNQIQADNFARTRPLRWAAKPALAAGFVAFSFGLFAVVGGAYEAAAIATAAVAASAGFVKLAIYPWRS